MTCGIDGCKGELARKDDAFCPEHWKKLSREHRQELVRLRNASARGNRSATQDFFKATAVARHLILGSHLNG